MVEENTVDVEIPISNRWFVGMVESSGLGRVCHRGVAHSEFYNHCAPVLGDIDGLTW